MKSMIQQCDDEKGFFDDLGQECGDHDDKYHGECDCKDSCAKE